MKDSSDTRTEIIGGAFFVRKKKSHRSERKKGRNAEAFSWAGNRQGLLRLLFREERFFARRLMDK